MAGTALSVTVDVNPAVNLLRKAEKRVAYAISGALKSTILDVQTHIRSGSRSDIQIRKSGFIDKRLAKINQWPSPTQLWTRVFIDTAAVEGSPIILPELETGGTKLPQHGPGIAEPVTGSPVRRTFAKSVPKSLYYTALKLHAGPRGIRIGEMRTYEVPGVGVFQRIGKAVRRSRYREKGDASTVLIYGYHPDARLKRHLRFIPIATSVALSRFPVYLDEQIKATLAHHGITS